MNKIFIHQLKIPAIIGIHPHEQNSLQEIIMDLEMDVDISSAAQTDDIHFTINYAVVCETITQFVTKTNFKLIETLAEKIAAHLLQHFPAIFQLQVTITKKPADMPNVAGVSIYIKRQQQAVQPFPSQPQAKQAARDLPDTKEKND